NRIIAVGDIYFRLNKYLTGITFTYVNSLEDIYKRDIMTGDGYSIVCMYNEYDVIDRAMKNIIFVDVASDVNINLNYVGRDGKIYPQQWKVIDGVKLKSGHLVLLKNQDNDIENDIYVVTNKHFLENTNYLSTREKSNKFSCSVKLGTNADKQYFLSGSTALASINNGYGFPISFEPKTFIKGDSYIIKHLISYNLYNTLRGNQQIIELNSGFNIVSFNMTPINPDIKAIFQPFIDYGILWKVIDEHGNSLDESDGFINHIGSVNPEEGYFVYIYRTATLTVTGTQIVLPIEINLSAGWNIMSYPAQKSQNAFSVVQPLINEGKLISVQDEVGNVIMNSGDTWFNYIGNFIPGKGYRIQVSENCVLQINESEENISTSKIIFTDYELARRQVDDNFELYNNFYVKIDSSSLPSKYITMIYHRDNPYIIRHDIESNSVVTGSISNIINTKS
ncbi:MAG TPA: hypothetical protein PK891_05790, partial [Bacteroidales bacterium]|nr:hypothetical protein [Bacteroidales bacterium]